MSIYTSTLDYWYKKGREEAIEDKTDAILESYTNKEYRFSLICVCGKTMGGLVGGDYQKDKLYCDCGLVWEIKKPYRDAQ